MKTLYTDRLVLREWELGDAPDMFEYAKTDEVGPAAGWKPHASVAVSEKVIGMFIDSDEVWAVVMRESGKVVGSIGLHKSEKDGVVFDRELGYVLSADYWGRGLIPEAAAEVMRFGFEEMGLNCIAVSHFPFNSRSRRVIEKLGFRYVRTLEGSWKRYDGALLDELAYVLTREEYEARRSVVQ